MLDGWRPRRVPRLRGRLEAESADLLLDGLVALVSDGAAASTAMLRTAVRAFVNDEVETEAELRSLSLAARVAGYIWDFDDLDVLNRRQVRVARESGALTVLPLSLSSRAVVELHSGNLAEASSLIAEATAISDATDGGNRPFAPLALAAYRGREPDASRLIDRTTADLVARGEGIGLTIALWANAYLHNGLARYDVALAAAEQAAEDPYEIWFSPMVAVELIEAATRCGRQERARNALEVLTETTRTSGTPWAQGIEGRSRALLADGQAAENLYSEAIAHLRPTRLRVDLARTHLLYGEWLRRKRRRIEARTELRTAYELFSQFGMEGFAERTRVELEATGEHARKRTADTLGDLTPQEAQIARLVTAGHNNRDIAAQLFISPRTVEYHLHKVFRKLGVNSRTQLARRLS